MGTLADVLWGSAFGGLLAWPLLDTVWRFLSFTQRRRVGHFGPVA